MFRSIVIVVVLFFCSSCARQRDYDDVFCRGAVPVKEQKTIVIDAGHGGKDPGSESTKFDYQEKALTLATARLLSDYLHDLGYRIVMTREDDRFIPLKERAQIANNKKADLFVSVHYNYSSNKSAEGVEVFFYEGAEERKSSSHELAKMVLSRIVKHTHAHSRGVKTGRYAVIRETTMPAILVEGGFLSNEAERTKLKDPKYIHFIAFGIARGIDAYLKQ